MALLLQYILSHILVKNYKWQKRKVYNINQEHKLKENRGKINSKGIKSFTLLQNQNENPQSLRYGVANGAILWYPFSQNLGYGQYWETHRKWLLCFDYPEINNRDTKGGRTQIGINENTLGCHEYVTSPPVHDVTARSSHDNGIPSKRLYIPPRPWVVPTRWLITMSAIALTLFCFIFWSKAFNWCSEPYLLLRE